MAKVQSSLINGDLTFNADIVQASLKISPKLANLAHTATQGWVQAAALSPAGDQSFGAKLETEEVNTGGIESTKDDLTKKITGEGSFMATDLNPWFAKYAMGTNLDIQWQTTGAAATVTGTESTTTQIVLANSTEAATFATNDVFHVPLGNSSHTYLWPGIVLAVNDDTLLLKYALPEIPATSAEVTKVTGYNMWHGGNEILNLHVMVQLDFPKGDQHILDVLSCSMTGGFTRNLGGAVKTPASLKMYGTQQDVGSAVDQVVVAVSRVTFPNG